MFGQPLHPGGFAMRPHRSVFLALLLALPLLALSSPTLAAQPAFERETDVVYGEIDGTRLLLDVYRPPARDTPRPAVVFVHGGGWFGGSRDDNANAARMLAQAGYVGFNIEYRLLDLAEGTNRWPAQLDDAQRAVRWVRANAARYGVDPARICSYGHSAGAHLAALLGVRDTRDNSDPSLAGYSSRVACVVDLAGVTDFTIPFPSQGNTELVADFLGGTMEEIPEVYHDASPIYYVDEQSAAFLIVHASKDTDTPVEHARRMEEALHAAGVEVVYAEFPNEDHLSVAGVLLVGPFALAFLGHQLHPER
jgi:acetyl esterase/lipase